ncbi:unnamed protein product [Arabidopsis lyrata]|uniref:MATE efflux family protein n=1 Tax=Arabidopsis lyrata subsp. lyrata TaxID=81972 RepID=D7KTM9_ARALL|nr:hypothetical protein ARALYDRAFT_894271 [Arabidopsis lyrata subsp. lyrata]CAH8257164.1 unnamed protein product [Arabidopsis lyrata]
MFVSVTNANVCTHSEKEVSGKILTNAIFLHDSSVIRNAVAIATSLTNVTGFSLLFGLAGALETLCGQAFGAEQFRKIGAYTYSSMLCLLLFCFPISLLWVFMDKLLELFHQDPLISHLACRYSIWLIPALFGYSVLQSMTRFFQSQGLVLPLFLSSLGALCFHIPFSWLLVYKLRFGIVSAADLESSDLLTIYKTSK